MRQFLLKSCARFRCLSIVGVPFTATHELFKMLLAYFYAAFGTCHSELAFRFHQLQPFTDSMHPSRKNHDFVPSLFVAPDKRAFCHGRMIAQSRAEDLA